MPLIILGLIVVVGGCLLIYYQFGPAISRRLGGAGGAERGRPDAVSRTREGVGADAGNDAKSRSEEAASSAEASGGDKVLFLFGSGQREERPLNRGDDYKGE